MLPGPTLPASLLAVLENLRWVFTAPSYATFAALATGLIANTGMGTVTGMLTGAGLARTWPHDRAHAFFSRAAWSSDTLGLYLSRLIVRTLLPAAAALTVAVDDTLFKKRGKKVFGAGWQHDGAARSEKPVGGCCFVVAGIVVELPFLTRPVCLPVAARLWRPKSGSTKVEIAAALVKQLAAWNRDRMGHVVADAAYHGPALRHLPARIAVTTRHPACAVLYDLAPPSGKRGRPRLKGDRLGTPPIWPRLCASRLPRSDATVAPRPCASPRSDACGAAPSTPKPCASSCYATTTPPPVTTWPWSPPTCTAPRQRSSPDTPGAGRLR